MNQPTTTYTPPKQSPHTALFEIQKILSEPTWDSDTPCRIGEAMKRHGYPYLEDIEFDYAASPLFASREEAQKWTTQKWTTITYRTGCCGLLARASVESLIIDRTENFFENDKYTNQEYVEGWEYCLHCATGEHHSGEYVVEATPYIAHGGRDVCRLPACCVAEIEGDALGLPR